MNKIQSMRIIKYEYDQLNKSPLSDIGVTVGLKDDDEKNINEWKLTLSGPKCSSYKTGIFLLRVKFPDDYPESPPQIIFNTPIYHLNINSTSAQGIPLGQVYLNSLIYWKRDYNMKKILPEIFVLLLNNNPECGYDSERNDEFRFKRETFEEKAKYFTKLYASPKAISKKIKYEGEWNFVIQGI